MCPRHRVLVTLLLVAGGSCSMLVACEAADAKPDKVARYARFQVGDAVSYGIVEGDSVRQIDGDLFGSWKATDRTYPLSSVRVLVPVARWSNVLAMAGNYKSHLGGGAHVTTVVTTTKVTTNVENRTTTTDTKTTADTEKPGEVPSKFASPQLFHKSPSCVIATGEKIVIPRGTNDVHFEGELVIVIGKKAKNVSEKDAPRYILGVTCGNDVSARDWQKGDVQWWRAKGSDTFGPTGPFIAAGLDYDHLKLQTRVNGKTLQDDNTSQLIHNVPKIVSFASSHVTLEPGDLIFTGTPGTTSALQPGDKVEIEIQGVGTLVNTVASSNSP